MSSIDIRRAYVDDMHIISYVMSKSWQAAYTHIIPPEAMEESIHINCHKAVLDRMLSDGIYDMLICEYNGSPSGIIANNHQCGNVYEISLVYTLPEVWGTGCGNALMDEALRRIYNTGCSHVYLWVFNGNKRAQRFYEKYGFSADGTERNSQFGTRQTRYMLKLNKD